jgi:hypothetical protein
VVSAGLFAGSTSLDLRIAGHINSTACFNFSCIILAGMETIGNRPASEKTMDLFGLTASFSGSNRGAENEFLA